MVYRGPAPMSPSDLCQFLYERIPLTRAMSLDVVDITTEHVTLSAPLGPNMNHRDTAFGGSVCALAILSAWSLLYLRLRDAYPGVRIVIQRNLMVYDRPVTGAFTATSAAREPAAWEKFDDAFRRKRRARINLQAVLRCGDEPVGHLDAAFVADRTPV